MVSEFRPDVALIRQRPRYRLMPSRVQRGSHRVTSSRIGAGAPKRGTDKPNAAFNTRCDKCFTGGLGGRDAVQCRPAEIDRTSMVCAVPGGPFVL